MAPLVQPTGTAFGNVRTASLTPASASWRAFAESPARREKPKLFNETSSKATMRVVATNMTITAMAMLPSSFHCRRRMLCLLPVVPQGRRAGHVEERRSSLVLDEQLDSDGPRAGVVGARVTGRELVPEPVEEGEDRLRCGVGHARHHGEAGERHMSGARAVVAGLVLFDRTVDQPVRDRRVGARHSG